TNLRGLNRTALAGFVRDVLGEDEAVALRLFKEIWQRGATSFDHMPTLRKSFRDTLAEHATLDELPLARTLHSKDGTIKFLWGLEEGRTIESVLIPDGHRVTLCISSQVGCAMACTFCLTGDMGLIRHLTTAEIVGQPYQVQRYLGDSMRITNLVLMGMGEPLHNLPALVPALQICLDEHALNYSHRRVTVSTVGLVPKIAELANALPVNLAISLNATTEAHRRQIMPVTRKYSMQQLLDQCRTVKLPRGKRITFEYVMFAGENDTLEDAERLRLLLEGIPAKVNLIPYNENPGRPQLKRPSDEVVKAFQHHLVMHGTSCSIRTTRGIDISAACGQLGKTAA
ncbi:MAG: 23S rRNA (adenine(2503)-C(2))-methyltransferase RlmN, partial [Myxococcota bacterium]